MELKTNRERIELLYVHYSISEDIIIAFTVLNILLASIGENVFERILEKFWVFVGVGSKVVVVS